MNKEFYLYKVISLLIISVFFCNCSSKRIRDAALSIFFYLFTFAA